MRTRAFALGFLTCALCVFGAFGFTHSDVFRARSVVAANNAAVVSLRAQITTLQASQVVANIGGTWPTVPDGAVTTIHWGSPNVGIETTFPFAASCSLP